MCIYLMFSMDILPNKVFCNRPPAGIAAKSKSLISKPRSLPVPRPRVGNTQGVFQGKNTGWMV